MLQVIFLIIILILSPEAFAQTYQPGQVPAFLKNEANREQYQQPLSQQYQQQYQQQPQQPQLQYQQQYDSSVPAFMQKEMQEQQQYQQQYQQQMQQIQQQPQYNYQSADPNSASYTLPPATYQPAPGETPAFILQQQNPSEQPKEEQQTIKSNQKEDIIQINFSDDQYKNDEEVTPLSKDQAKEYNTEVNHEEGVSTTELQEGAKFEGADKNATAAAPAGENPENTEKEAEIEKAAVPEPEKTQNNVLRIAFSQEVTELSDKDKAGLISVVKLLKNNKNQKILITANTSERDIGISADKVGLMRIIGIRDYLMKQGVDFSQTEVKVKNTEKNKENLDYIDIDKI